MTRPGLLDYAGAGARLSPERALALPPSRWAWQPKIDGCYARATLDSHGKILRVVSRTGAPIPQARDLLGIVAGPPDSVLIGELEAHTEAGIRAAATRGYANLHLFDVSRLDGRSMEREPYTDRYGALHLAQATLECAGPGRRHDWTEDATGRAHSTASGRFARAIPRDLRRLPIVPLARGTSAGEQLWRSHVEVGGGEGLVAVRLDAPLGARGAKRKVKHTDTIDGVCVSASRGGSTIVATSGAPAGTVIVVGSRVEVGATVEVAHDGWYEASATPRFARVVRRRDDLAAPSPDQ